MLQEMAVENLFLKMLHVIKIMVLFSPEYQQFLHWDGCSVCITVKILYCILDIFVLQRSALF
jgi:hypothetical protein